MLPPINYLIIGHLSYDITPDGVRLGGTASYASVTAHAFGKSVGIVTSWGEESDLHLGQLKDIPLFSHPSPNSTSFKNIQTPHGREQILFNTANSLSFADIPTEWYPCPIVHIAPIVHEVHPEMIKQLSTSFIGITPQGWLRSWGEDGVISLVNWDDFLQSVTFNNLQYANAVVISDEDVGLSQPKIEDLANHCPLLIVTQGAKGARLFWQGETSHVPAMNVSEKDPVGAGDVFASTFFIHFHKTQDIIKAAQIAAHIAAFSVTRSGQLSAPTQDEINFCLKD